MLVYNYFKIDFVNSCVEYFDDTSGKCNNLFLYTF